MSLVDILYSKSFNFPYKRLKKALFIPYILSVTKNAIFLQKAL